MSLMDNFTLIPYGYFPLLNCKRTVSKSNLLNQFTVEGNNFFFSHFRQAAAVASRKTARKVDNAEGNY